MIKTILAGHTSPETAFLVESYPYSFKLRCKIRYWLETNKKGTRFVSQTTNPKASSEVWNKPKASTYTEISGCMYLDENEHVQWTTVSQYTELDKCKEYLANCSEGATNLDGLKKHIRRKEIYEDEMGRFTPRPSYGDEFFKLAYGATIKRCRDEGL